MITEFKEEQKFTQWWLWIILIGVAVFPIYGVYKQIIQGLPFGDKPMSDVGLIIFAVFSLGLIILFRLFKLTTKIDHNTIHNQFFPFSNRVVNWQDVKWAEVITYSFVGYGIRFSTKYGTVYNIKGNGRLALELKSGKKIIIGTQKKHELIEVATNVFTPINE